MLYEEFLRICKELNRICIQPLLYGSLGLERLSGQNLNPQDIDILVPEVYLHEKWLELLETASHLGYTLADIHEHEFTNSKQIVAFASLEELESFAGITATAIEAKADGGCGFLLLNATQYFQVYTRSSLDGYRRDKKKKKDDEKIDLILHLLMDEGA